MTARRIFTVVGLIAGLAALILQFSLTIPARLGYPAVALNITVVLAILLALFAITITLDRLLPRKR